MLYDFIYSGWAIKRGSVSFRFPTFFFDSIVTARIVCTCGIIVRCLHCGSGPLCWLAVRPSVGAVIAGVSKLAAFICRSEAQLGLRRDQEPKPS